jgi:FtsP/CotA-like multicopper oxidase with cupredoxin domain
MTRQISRREALKYGLGTAAAVAVPARLLGAGPSTRIRPARAVRRVAQLTQPKVLSSADGELSLTLTARRGVVDMGAPQRVKTYTYDGIVPGSTWEVHPGDTLKVRLVNHLPELEDQHPDLDRPHEWTNTNLHTHGLHVSPAGNADNVFLDLAPGAEQQHEIAIPGDHPGGFFWYHPHRHGAVTQQVRAGMAGALIVRGAIDEVEEVAAAKERVLVLQAIELGDDYELLDPIPHPTTEQAFFPRTQVLYTVNGALTPTIKMYPGEVQRWRMVNAAEGKFMSLRLERHDFHVLAWDGLTLAAPDDAEILMMSAGNRVEALVRAGKPGKYDLVLTPGSSQRPDIPGMPGAHLAATPSTGPTTTTTAVPPEFKTRTIATIEVTGDGPAMGLPTALPAFDPPILPIAKTRDFTYTVQRDPDDEFLSFGVDGVPFDVARPPYQMKLGTAEEWTLTNAHDHKLMRHAHAFHIHTNPFKVTRVNGVDLATPLWRDTYVLTGDTGDSFTFQSNFDDFTGKLVEHCHVLAHEDLGMMESLEIIP